MRRTPSAPRIALGALPFVAVLALVLASCGSSSAPSSSGNPDAAANQGVAFPPTGNQYVDARRCPACHQSATPQTTGFMSGAVQPIAGNFGTGVSLYGPNLTPDPTTGIGSWSDDEISTAILNGIDNQGQRLCPQMQHFPTMGMPELTSIIGYLHSLKPVTHQSTPSHCPPLKK